MFQLYALQLQDRVTWMRNETVAGESTYYNEFVDLKDFAPMKIRHKTKNNNLDNIKLATKKLPPDFFRPHTRENPTENNRRFEIDREGFNKTPCFGDDKKQSYSLSLIPKEKRNLDYDHHRVATLPVQESDSNKIQVRRNCTRQLSRKKNEFSHRLSHNRQLGKEQQNQSTQRQKIKYKKMTLNDEIYLEEKKALNLQYENRIRLNIKKFFREENEFVPIQGIEKSARKVTVPTEKTKIKKLPPIL